MHNVLHMSILFIAIKFTNLTEFLALLGEECFKQLKDNITQYEIQVYQV